MADTTTELEVLDQIVDVLGGQSGQYETVVPVLQQIKELLAAGITDPEAIAEAVTAWLDEHPEATTTVRDGSITVMKLAQDVIELLDDKADIDGYYSQLTAGLAENLICRGDAVPAEYLYRTAGGDADIEDGIATIDCIKGNTLVWNQIIGGGSDKTTDYADVTFTWTAERNELTVAVNSEVAATRNYLDIPFGVSEFVDGHKYLFPCYSRGDSSEPERYVYAGATAYSGPIFTWSSGSETPHARARVLTTTPTGTWKYIYQLFDLTLMFGAGNEPSTVEEFEAMFPNAYYPYSEPMLLSVNMKGIETVGFNLLNIERSEVVNTSKKGGAFDSTTTRDLSENQVWIGITMNNYFSPNNIVSYSIGNESVSVSPKTTGYGLGFPVKVFPNTEYHLDLGAESSANSIFAIGTYTEDGTYIKHLTANGIASKSITFTTPSECRWAMVVLRPALNTTANYVRPVLNLSWSGYRNGEYEEYWKSQREISVETYFPDGMRSAGSVRDELTPTKAITRVGVVDMGTLSWTYVGEPLYRFQCMDHIPNRTGEGGAGGDSRATPRLTTAAYTSLTAVAFDGDATVDKTICGSSTDRNVIFVRDLAYTDVAALKASLSGVMLYYELAEPTEVTIDPPLNLSYKMSDFGTEKVMVDEEADAPQSAPPIIQTAYGINATDTVRRLPTQYISHESFQQFVAALQSAVGITVTETWDENDGRYEYTVTQTGE